jgi:hypothetical protein
MAAISACLMSPRVKSPGMALGAFQHSPPILFITYGLRLEEHWIPQLHPWLLVEVKDGTQRASEPIPGHSAHSLRLARS